MDRYIISDDVRRFLIAYFEKLPEVQAISALARLEKIDNKEEVKAV